jgi:ribose transport system ATP-binding protein
VSAIDGEETLTERRRRRYPGEMPVVTDGGEPDRAPLLEARSVSKRYGTVQALHSASLAVWPGEVHALVGANGAGKSTLVKVITGVVRADSGWLSVGGLRLGFSGPEQARASGVYAVFQEPSLVPGLTVAQNLVLSRSNPHTVAASLAELGANVDLGARVERLSLAALRLIDLARALSARPNLLVLDEATAALPPDLAEGVFAAVRRLRDAGRSVLFVSHRLAEIREVCDRATVLRDGTTVGVLVVDEQAEASLVELMLGRPLGDIASPVRTGAGLLVGTATVQDVPPDRNVARKETGGNSGQPRPPGQGERVGGVPANQGAARALEVSRLRVGSFVHDVSLSVEAGEVLGLAALDGQGQQALFEALAGVRHFDAGQVLVAGKPARFGNPFDAIRAGIVYVPANRLDALLPKVPVEDNIALAFRNRPKAWPLPLLRSQKARVLEAIGRLEIDRRAAREAGRLSGGNQQKVTLARWLATGFKVMLCFDPTAGIDVGTKQQIYKLLRELASEGAAVFLYTSEFAEFPLVCDRVLVMYAGQLVGEMPGKEATEVALLRAAHGLVSQPEGQVAAE